jgi:undecaprenyl diphosphate synthase
MNFTSQSTLHVAMIMDGNGRWAQSRGLPRVAGHRQGVETVTRIVEAAPDLGVSVLTLFAFSCDNWRRPQPEIDALMLLLALYLDREVPRCLANGVRLEMIGRRDRLDPALQRQIRDAEQRTSAGRRLRLRMAVDYSARDSILAAASSSAAPSRESVAEALGPEVDLLIRTGGEQRLSDFLLWECAYAEFVFSRRMWPDFAPADLAAALREFHRRQRRFGAVPEAPVPLSTGWLD